MKKKYALSNVATLAAVSPDAVIDSSMRYRFVRGLIGVQEKQDQLRAARRGELAQKFQKVSAKRQELTFDSHEILAMEPQPARRAELLNELACVGAELAALESRLVQLLSNAG